MDFSALSQSQPRPRMLLVPRADPQCCPAGFSPEPCRGCNPKTQICQQLVPTNCQCPYNTCVNISGASSGSGAGSSVLGGALGGILGALAVAIALFLFWRQKRHRSKLLQARVKADAKVRAAAAEKFRPARDGAVSAPGLHPSHRPISQSSSKRSARLSGGALGPSASAGGAGAAAGTGTAPNSSHGHGSSANSGTGRPSTSDPFADPDGDEDTEWTELRADGLTTFKKPTDEDAEEDEMLDGLGALVNRRHSTGAATHLSRITEGEEDEDERRSLAPTVRSSVFRMSHHAPPMPADAVTLAQQAAGILAPVHATSLRPHSALSSRTGSSSGGGARGSFSNDVLGTGTDTGVTTADSTQSAAVSTATSLALPMSSLSGGGGGGSGTLLTPRSGSHPNPNRLSTLTTATGISMASSIGDYVITTSQTVTPETAKRVQVSSPAKSP
ncbi:hypothetical protein OC834_004455 [Tilletia horrida]|uniref:Membrane anchor Opy2 N-terminal domain-containing protein n=1 Tax=Tilletia horrida TaxID=155126 RepID=A0AAN6G9A8_9BASI|nr:hypothetical protein OC834_004455 [Tilletia horrida]KAK0528249.1 hypothetical protein OC842_004613 [Tilletia horrida]KAK0529992.1 hypothetical protein OC835_004154 [Tilletia horrida]KAK0567087.1 hypothetical protein OC844_000425 [Tilletia horrida]